MAIAHIPPCGAIHDAAERRERLHREQTSPDPVERYRLREERLNEELTDYGKALANQAKAAAKNIQKYNQKGVM